MFQIPRILSRNKFYHNSVLCLFKQYPILNAASSSFKVTSIYPIRKNTTFTSNKLEYEDRKYFLDDYFNGAEKSVEWEHIKSQFIESDRNATKQNVDALIIKYLATRKYWQHGKDFLNYLDNSGVKLNIGAISIILMFYFRYGVENKLDDKDKTFIKQIYKDILSKYTVLEGSVAENCIGALSLTEDWKEGLKMIEKIESIYTPTNLTYSCLAWTAFIHNEPDTGWSMLKKMSQHLLNPRDKVFLSMISNSISNCGSDKSKFFSDLEKLFYYCSENNINIGKSVADKVIDACHSHSKWVGNLVTIGQRGVCPACSNKLSPIVLTEEDFEELRKSFMERVLIGKNIFIKTSPEEQKRFLKMLDRTAPYDIVLDGLNIAYSKPNYCKPSYLSAVVKKFASENKKILVLGRRHMEKWPKEDMDFIRNNSFLFLADDLSYDDPFILLAALRSMNTKFLSRDFMRGHKQMLNNEKLQLVFKRWQQRNQMYLKFIQESSGRVIIQEPFTHLPVCQKDIGWHIPYNLEDDKEYRQSNEIPANWICLLPPK